MRQNRCGGQLLFAVHTVGLSKGYQHGLVHFSKICYFRNFLADPNLTHLKKHFSVQSVNYCTHFNTILIQNFQILCCFNFFLLNTGTIRITANVTAESPLKMGLLWAIILMGRKHTLGTQLLIRFQCSFNDFDILMFWTRRTNFKFQKFQF